MAEGKYTAGDIEVLEGLEHVRKRPGMYIGTTDIRGLHQILWEIIDNSIDEAANFYANRIDVTLNDDGSVTVEDNGRGIPVDMHSAGMPAVQLIFSTLNAGGKFSGKNYKYSAGLHGVGASVTNALSEWLYVEIFREKKHYRIDFASVEEKGKIKSGALKEGLRVVGKTDKKGTRVTFKPDARVFDTVVFDAEEIEDKLREIAFLTKNLFISFTDNRNVTEDNPAYHVEFKCEKGLSDFVGYLNADMEDLNKIMMLEGELNGITVQVALQHNGGISEKFYSYVNNVRTLEGGTHVTGFRSAFTKGMNDFAKNNNSLKNKKVNIIGDDFKEGLTAVLSIQMSNPQFEGQTKSKLGNSEVRSIVESLIYAKMSEFFSNPKNKSIGDYIIKKAIEVAGLREKLKEIEETEKKKNSITGTALIGKFASCSGKNPVMNELFIVEGDSAGGSAKQGRDRRTQAVLPLRGKPMNVLKKRKDKIYQNEEIRTIIAALGTGIGSSFKIEDLKFHKVIILSDADYDGYHIRTLLLAFFYRLMPELIHSGKVFVGMPPLYKVEKKNKVVYAYDDEELDKVVSEIGGGSDMHIQRYKGLGEMNKDQLWETTLNPKTRLLTKVTIVDAMRADEIIDILMTDDKGSGEASNGEKGGAERRKDYIYRHAKFNRVDNFAMKYGNKNGGKN